MSVHSVNPKLRARLLAGDEPAWLRRHPRRSYIWQLALATPPWASMKAIRALDRKAREMSRPGRKYVVDHVIPITNKRVCGLNVHANMAVIRAETNARKSNHWCEWHGELFADPEQFSLWPQVPRGATHGAQA